MLDEVSELKDEDDGRTLIDPFVKLPLKKLYPDYYTIIKQPITMTDIQKKNSRGKYATLREFEADFELLYNNAAKYNDPESWLVTDAQRVLDTVREKVREAEEHGHSDVKVEEQEEEENVGDEEEEEVEEEAEEEEEEEEDNDDIVDTPAPVEIVKKRVGRKKKEETTSQEATTGAPQPITFNSLVATTTGVLERVRDFEFPELGVLSAPFLDDIDRDEYPDYFAVIKLPTSINRVLNSVQKKNYFNPKRSMRENLETFERDVKLIWSNAQIYNDPSSLIHQDSQKLNDKFEEEMKKVWDRLDEEKLKLRIKKKEPKLVLKLAAGDKERRGRKRKVVVPPAELVELTETVKPEDHEDPMDLDQEAEDGEGDDEEQEGVELKASVGATGTSLKAEVSTTLSGRSSLVSRNEPGKTANPADLSKKDSFIQQVSVCSSTTYVHQLQSNGALLNSQPIATFTEFQQAKKLLFPAHPVVPMATLFEYKFPTEGFSNLNYAVTLPQDGNVPGSLVTFKVSLHELFYQLKKPDLLNNQGFILLTLDEEFQCRLFLNDEEVNTGGEVYEDHPVDDSEGSESGETATPATGEDPLLNFQYELKLSHGLNVLSFEIKVAPSLSKKLKRDDKSNAGEEEVGRHTRHQLQQIKMSWDVEKVNILINNNVY